MGEMRYVKNKTVKSAIFPLSPIKGRDFYATKKKEDIFAVFKLVAKWPKIFVYYYIFLIFLYHINYKKKWPSGQNARKPL